MFNRKLSTALGTAILMMGAVSSQVHAASASTSASANVVAPITITQNTALDFGTLIPDTAVQTVAVTAAGAISASGAVTLVGGHAAGNFTVQGTAGESYVITDPGVVVITAGANTMNVDTWIFTTADCIEATAAACGGGATVIPGVAPALGSDTMTVGATLHVGANQAAGAYTATFNMTVNYQ
ncbi:MAG: DUF4402 domain-containing protein [Gammaproteobacteria bacterium]|nr:DUF4402 domain-containing protein [Gammaproteobacteria bacterium]